MRLQRTLVPPPSPSNSSDDARLVARVRAGEPAALGELYSRYARPLFGLAQRLMGPEQDAEDVLHDVFLGLPEALRQYEEQGSLDAWLKRVTARVALNRLRSYRRRNESSLMGAAGAPTRAAHPLDALALRDALAQLPEKLRAVFVLKAIEGFSHSEVADLLQISRSASEVRLHRAIRSLRHLLEPER